MTNTAIVIAANPEDRLERVIRDRKRQVLDLVGDQLYLKDDPHVTLYAGNVVDVSAVNGIMNRIGVLLSKIKIEIKGWRIFDDTVTEKKTLVYELERKSVEVLQNLQKQLFDGIALLLSKKLLKRFEGHYSDFGKEYKDNLDTYGFPFVGEDFIPHLTIASIDKERFDEVWKHLKKERPGGKYMLVRLSLYVLNEEGDKITKIMDVGLR